MWSSSSRYDTKNRSMSACFVKSSCYSELAQYVPEIKQTSYLFPNIYSTFGPSVSQMTDCFAAKTLPLFGNEEHIALIGLKGKGPPIKLYPCNFKR